MMSSMMSEEELAQMQQSESNHFSTEIFRLCNQNLLRLGRLGSQRRIDGSHDGNGWYCHNHISQPWGLFKSIVATHILVYVNIFIVIIYTSTMITTATKNTTSTMITTMTTTMITITTTMQAGWQS